MTGYQEILTDPSYAGQIVTLTYPHIGNTGVNPEDVESRRIFAAALVIRDLPRLASNWRSTQDLSSYLRDAGVLGICDIDTRKLTRMLRENGAQNGCVIAAAGVGQGDAAAAAIARARAAPSMSGLDLAKVVSCDAHATTGGRRQPGRSAPGIASAASPVASMSSRTTTASSTTSCACWPIAVAG